MIKEIRKPELLKYGRFFLSTEAEDEEVPQPKRNTKVIDVKPNNRRRIDFTDGAEEPEQIDEPSEETPDLPDTSTDEPDATNDFDPSVQEPTSDGTDPSVQQPEGEQPAEGDNMPDTSSDTDFTNEEQPNEGNAGGGEEGADVTGDTGEGPDVGGEDTDFTDDTGADAGTEGEQPAEGDAGGEKKGPGLEFDSTRKYNLFENYMSLANAINNYISKLEKNMSDDYVQNQVYKVATEKLREIHDLCYDYMTLRFEISTYVQSLLFFQELVIMVQMVFDLIEKSKKVIKNSNTKLKH